MPYYPFINENGEKYGSFEIFYHDKVTPDFVTNPEAPEEEQEPAPIGWYWWSCFPGCLPDSSPNGPFATEEEAINSAQF
jgi:hypothetical protein